jgi:hypothetical protein
MKLLHRWLTPDAKPQSVQADEALGVFLIIHPVGLEGGKLGFIERYGRLPTVSQFPLYNFTRAVPVTFFCDSSIAAWSIMRSGANQYP